MADGATIAMRAGAWLVKQSAERMAAERWSNALAPGHDTL